MIEVVDRADRIDAILPVLDEMIEEGLVTVEPMRVVRYRSGRDPGEPGEPV